MSADRYAIDRRWAGDKRPHPAGSARTGRRPALRLSPHLVEVLDQINRERSDLRIGPLLELVRYNLRRLVVGSPALHHPSVGVDDPVLADPDLPAARPSQGRLLVEGGVRWETYCTGGGYPSFARMPSEAARVNPVEALRAD